MRVGLVTGAAGGIGSATVRALAAQGYGVAMLGGSDPSGCRFMAVAPAAGTYGLHNLAATVVHADGGFRP